MTRTTAILALALLAGCGDGPTAPALTVDVTFSPASQGGCNVTIGPDTFHGFLAPGAVVAGVAAPESCTIGYDG